MKRCIPLLLTIFLLASCGGGSDSDSSNSSSITISGAVTTASELTVSGLSAKGLAQKAITDYDMYCVAFNEAASSDSDSLADGEFSLELPADTPFGCFIVDPAANNSIVATLTIEDNSQEDLAGQPVKSTSMSLGSSVSLGTLTFTEGSTEIIVSASQIAEAVSTKASDLDIDDIHNTSWTLSCLDSSDSACAAFVSESSEVYFRIIKATHNTEGQVYGLGVWASQEAFAACGSADVETGGMSGAVSEGYTFTQLTEGAFTSGVSCPLRDGGDPAESDNLQLYYTLEKLIVSGNMFTLLEEEEETYTGLGGNPCTEYEKFSVSFTPSGASTLYGQFEQTEKVSGAGCDPEDIESETSSFKVKFTKQ
jgi:hypothetical protein